LKIEAFLLLLHPLWILFKSISETGADACPDACPDARTETRADACPDARTETRAYAGTDTCPETRSIPAIGPSSAAYACTATGADACSVS
jgi:hypothetical protein